MTRAAHDDEARREFVTLKYGRTRCYLLRGSACNVMVDTDLAGTMPALMAALHEHGLSVADAGRLMVTHFHPDHMGLARALQNAGVRLVVWGPQVSHAHDADGVYRKWGRCDFHPVDDGAAQVLPLARSRDFLAGCGIAGRVLATPGHSPDSVSVVLDSGDAFVGDLCPSEQAALFPDPAYELSWKTLLEHGAKRVRFAHWPDEEHPHTDT